jgi:hypothetical protein
VVTENRVEFGAIRTKCSCSHCITNCKFIPGYLIPADLGRLIPPAGDPEEWARTHLRASPGAKLLRQHNDGRQEIIQIGTLVPAHNHDLSCHWLHDGRCEIHANAPFACAYFDCGQSKQYADELSLKGINAIIADHNANGLYSRLWTILWGAELRSPSPDVKRAAMAVYLDGR